MIHSTNAFQRAVDHNSEIEMQTTDKHSYHAAETALAALDEVYSAELYCATHRVRHSFPIRDLEKLIYGLTADLADTMGEADLGDRSTPDEILARFCPLDQLRSYCDGEVYLEHIDSMVEARRTWEVSRA